jgi:F5/8 type C domain
VLVPGGIAFVRTPNDRYLVIAKLRCTPPSGSCTRVRVASALAGARSGVNDGDRKGLNWGNGGGWNDGTADVFPDWVQINFNGTKTITEVDVFTLQDSYWFATDPTPSMTFSQFGITDFQVQYWNGSTWVTVPGGSVTGNNLVWPKITFSAITADRIRVLVTGALADYSRIVEVEAWGKLDRTAVSRRFRWSSLSCAVPIVRT